MNGEGNCICRSIGSISFVQAQKSTIAQPKEKRKLKIFALGRWDAGTLEAICAGQVQP
jgi:hypothetical protein